MHNNKTIQSIAK